MSATPRCQSSLNDLQTASDGLSFAVLQLASEVIEQNRRLPLLMLWTAPSPAHRCHGCGGR
jgi:hypothetical protein